MTRSDLHRRNDALTGIAVAFVLAAAPVFGQRGSLPSQPPMGEYVCHTSRLQLSPIQGPFGPIMTVTYGPSVLGTLELDGKGGYTVNGKSGQYRYDSSFTWVCLPNDTHACRIRAFVRNGVVMRVEQNYDHQTYEDLYGNRVTFAHNPRMCLKGFTFH